VRERCDELFERWLVEPMFFFVLAKADVVAVIKDNARREDKKILMSK